MIEDIYCKCLDKECPPRCSKEVLQISTINKQQLIYNKRTQFLIIGLFSMMLAFMFGLGSTILDPNADINHMFSLWSVAHFFTGFGLVYLLMVVSSKLINNTIYVSIFLILYEGLEEIMRQNNFIVTFSSESWQNVVGDLIVDMLGTILAYILISSQIKSK